MYRAANSCGSSQHARCRVDIRPIVALDAPNSLKKLGTIVLGLKNAIATPKKPKSAMKHQKLRWKFSGRGEVALNCMIPSFDGRQ
jgi:hypothetical protein